MKRDAMRLMCSIYRDEIIADKKASGIKRAFGAYRQADWLWK